MIELKLLITTYTDSSCAMTAAMHKLLLGVSVDNNFPEQCVQVACTAKSAAQSCKFGIDGSPEMSSPLFPSKVIVEGQWSPACQGYKQQQQLEQAAQVCKHLSTALQQGKQPRHGHR